MIKQTTLAIAVVLLLGYVGPSQQGAPCKTPDHIQAWTPWLDRDDPSGSGDWEPITDLLTDNPETMCSKPIDMEVMTISGLTIKQTKENIYVNDLTHGFGCRNTDQINRNCSDYKVRFSCSPKSCENVCWTKWYDRDNPTRTGDWENLGALHKENAKGSICAIPVYIEAVYC
ncbi:cartilage intermediate layer protein 1-like [Anableps anableps]